MSFFRTKPNTGPNTTSTGLHPNGGQPMSTSGDHAHNPRTGAPPAGKHKHKPMTTPMSPLRRRRLWKSYGLDWALTIIVWAIFYALDKVTGYRRLFSITDTSLSYPYAENERIPVWALALIAGIFPLVVVLAWAGGKRRSWFDAQVGALGLGLGLGLSSTFTNIIKITVGRPRPDFLARCQPPPTYTQNPAFGLTSWTICTRTDLLNDGYRSFFSGHSSFGWAGMWYLTLFMAGKMRIWDRRGYTLKSWLLLIPISAASLISVSRTMDYRHHATDVIAGAIVGILFSWYTYRQYYPALSDPCAHRPYPPRIPREDEDGPGRDVENGGVPDTENYRPEAGMNDEEDPYGRLLSTADSRIPLVVGQYRQQPQQGQQRDGLGTGGISSPTEAHVQSRFPVHPSTMTTTATTANSSSTTSNGFASTGINGQDAVQRFK